MSLFICKHRFLQSVFMLATQGVQLEAVTIEAFRVVAVDADIV